MVSVTLKYYHKGKSRQENFNFSDADTKIISDLCHRLENLWEKEMDEEG